MPDPSKHQGSPPDSVNDPVRDLVRAAGRPSAMPEDAFQAIRAAAHDTWRARLDRQRQTRRRVWALAAVLCVVTLGVAWLLRSPQGPRAPTRLPITVALAYDATRTTGSSADAAMPLASGQTLPSKSVVTTGAAGRLALRLAEGLSVRLATESTIALDHARSLTLVAGTIYVDNDSGASSRADPAGLVVKTPFGTVRDIGTQFTVTLNPLTLDVAVREGAVEMARDGQRLRAEAGEGLRVAADGTVTNTTVPSHGPAWSWILATAPPFDLEGQSLDAFLRWVTRETGWRLRYDQPDLAREASSTAVHGSIDDLAPHDALALVLPSAGFTSRLEGGTLVVLRDGG